MPLIGSLVTGSVAGSKRAGVTSNSPVTVMAKTKVPAWVGTPEMLPVWGLRTSPGGNWPWLTVKRYGAEPPLTDRTM